MRGPDLGKLFVLLGYIYILPYVTVILLTSLAAIIGRKTTSRPRSAESREKPCGHRFLVVIPAHNEEANIETTVLSCQAMRYPASQFEVVVLADNCTDGTAARARGARARVVERVDPIKRSKGHAIEYLIDMLVRSGEFDVLDALVIVDADSTVQPNLLEQFSLALDQGMDWMQCYDSVGNTDQSWRTRLMAYGFSLINGVTLAGQNALGFSAGLRGNGMCISTNGLRRVPWQARGLAEDLEYSWTVRIAGERIFFIKDAAVFATMLSEGGKPLANQRRRWEFGRSALRYTMLGPLLRSPHLGWVQKAAAVVELTTQPTIHIICLLLLLSIIDVYTIPKMITYHNYVALAFICIAHTIATLAIAIHALSPFLLSLLPWRFALCLGCIPYYVLWKLFVLAQGRPQGWVRTSRQGDRSTIAPLDVRPDSGFRPENRQERLAGRDA